MAEALISHEKSAAAKAEENPDKGYVQTLVLTTFFGTFGVDRFYLGKTWTGVLKLLTFGGFGLWTFIDFIVTLFGGARQKDKDIPLEGTRRYKSFFVKIAAVFLGLWIAILVLEFLAFAILLPGLLKDSDTSRQTPFSQKQFDQYLRDYIDKNQPSSDSNFRVN